MTTIPPIPLFIEFSKRESPRYLFPGTLPIQGSVPEPNLSHLFDQQLYQEIEKILDSSEYTKDVLQAWILNPQGDESASESSFFDFFHRVCTDRLVPIELVIKIIHIIREKNLNLYACLDCLKSIVPSKRDTEDKIYVLLELFEKLNDIEAKVSMLATVLIHSNDDFTLAILESGFIEKEIMLARHPIMTEHENGTESVQEVDSRFVMGCYCFEHDATMLEIAFHKKMQFKIIKKLVEIGGRELLLLSTRSLLQGALVEYNGGTAIKTAQYLLEIGGKDLVMIEKSWEPSRTEEKSSILHFLSYQKYDLRKTIGLDAIAKIMKTFIDLGGRDLVLRLSGGISVLHRFLYFQHEEFIRIVRLLVNIGGMELLSNRDPLYSGENYSILHKLCQSETDYISDEVWKILACNKEIVMMVENDGQTALHLACKANRLDCIASLLAQGGKDLVVKQDRKKNTALHYLPSTRKKDNAHFEIAEKILRVGGRELLECKNKSKNTPFFPFISKALEFKFDNTSGMIQSGENEIDENVMQQDNLGKTVLHIACERNNCNDVRSLLERGGKALAWKRDVLGNTALHYLISAQRKNCSHFEIAEMILNVGGKELLDCKNNARKKPFLPFIAKAIEFQFDLDDNVPDYISSINNDSMGNSERSNDLFATEDRYSEKMRALEEENKRLNAELHEKDLEITRLRQDAMKRSREEDIENDISEHFVTPYKKVKFLETVVTSVSSSKDLNPTNMEFSL